MKGAGSLIVECGKAEFELKLGTAEPESKAVIANIDDVDTDIMS